MARDGTSKVVAQSLDSPSPASGRAGDPPLVSICVCTFRREMVVDTINSLLAQTGVEHSRVEIIVCDDDPAQSARDLVAALSSTAPALVRYVASGAANVAICRNTCIASAAGHWIAFVDDDETAEANWLSELLKAQVRFGADVVKGFVRARYPAGAPRWVVAGDPFTRDPGPTGTPLSYFGTGNVMFRRSLVLENNLTFDASFGPTGGEDTDFFVRFGHCGAVMISCRTAIVNELVSLSRLTWRYLARRFYRYGQGYARIFISHQSPARRILALARSLAGIALGASFALVGLVSGAAAFRLFRLLWFHAGVFGWALGHSSLLME
jgi:succinoglycan biosynthesis protein ExoM